MRTHTRTEMLGLLLLSVVFHWPAIAQDSGGSGGASINSIIESMEKAQSGRQPHLSYQVVREYRLFGRNSSNSDSRVIAEVNFRPPTSKDYEIQDASGSKR